MLVGGNPSWPGDLVFSHDSILREELTGRVPRRAFIGRGILLSPRTVATAFHESGHAIAGFVLGRNVPKKISILPEDGSLGRTLNRPFPRWFRPELRLTTRTREALEIEMVTVLAGFAAEKRHTGKPNYFGSREDIATSNAYAALVAPDDVGAVPYRRWCAYRASQVVAEQWKAIEHLARALLAAGELRGRKLDAVLIAACRSVKRTREPARCRPRGRP